jgi:glycosyltransferase involved in cell wall biosynthesis
VGRLIEVKNPLVILKSFELSADASTRLIFVGEGNLREILHKEIIQCKFEEQVSLTGLVQREKVYEYLLNADLFISSSFIEGLPVAVLEAMACGCPALLSDIESHREIAAGVDFIPLIPPTDIKKFGDEIIRFRRMSPAERAEIGRKCRKLVEDRFSLTRMHKEYHKVYTELI